MSTDLKSDAVDGTTASAPKATHPSLEERWIATERRPAVFGFRLAALIFFGWLLFLAYLAFVAPQFTSSP